MDKPNGSSEVLRILLVEDNPNDLWLSRRWLEKADPSGFELTRGVRTCSTHSCWKKFRCR